MPILERHEKKLDILIIKTSSLGDLIHLFPAIHDLTENISNINIDWAVEENLLEAVSWNQEINNIIPVAIRRWRKSLYKISTWKEIKNLHTALNNKNYSYVIDAQGLIKSLIISKLSNGEVWGFDRRCNREKLTSFFYEHECHIAESFFQVHAIERNRRLFSKIFNYNYPPPIKYGSIIIPPSHVTHIKKEYIVFIHGTSRIEKEWPENNWINLAEKITEIGYNVILPWGNDHEYERAQRIKFIVKDTILLPKTSLSEIAYIIKNARSVIGVDTGLMHIASLLGVPGIAIFSDTNPNLFAPISNGDIVSQPKHIKPIISNQVNFDFILQELLNKIKQTT